MLYLERAPSGVVRMVIECKNPGLLNIARTALDCLSWEPGFPEDKDYQRAIRVLHEGEELEDGERVTVIECK